jgi:hypothetical protein
MNKIIKTLLVSMIALSLCHTMIGFTFPQFSDTEISIGNTFTAGVWESDADHLQVNTTCSCLSLISGKRGLILTKVTNTGASDITIDKILVDWDKTSSANITRIVIRRKLALTEFWSGRQPAGETLDGSDYTLVASDLRPKYVSFWFDSNMCGNTFTIRFILGDGSTKEVTITPDSCWSCGDNG